MIGLLNFNSKMKNSPEPALQFADNYWSSEGEEGYTGLFARLSISIDSMRDFTQLAISRSVAEEQYTVEVLKVISEYKCNETGYEVYLISQQDLENGDSNEIVPSGKRYAPTC
jgi:hypothetical protein